MKVKAIFCACFAALFTSLFCGCSAYSASAEEHGEEIVRYSRDYYFFNTSATLSVYDYFVEGGESYNAAISLGREAGELLEELENSLSVSVSSSYVSAFNSAAAGDTVEVDGHTYEVLSTAYKMYEQTGGAYNPAVYYSVDLYGFTARFNGTGTGSAMPYDRDDPSKELPEEQYVSAFSQLAQAFEDLRMYEEGGRYYVVKPLNTVTVEGREYSLAIDLGGIGKGYAADLVDALIAEYGFENGYFSFGSSSMAINGSATSEDGRWLLNFNNPRADGYFMSVRVRDAAVSVSGDDNQYYILDGRRYCHIIDPSTGSPIDTGIITAVCLGGTAAEDDARTTALCAMGIDRAKQYMEEHTELALAVIYCDGDDYYLYTNMPEEQISFGVEYEKAGEGVYRIALVPQEDPAWVRPVVITGTVIIVIVALALVGYYRRLKEEAGK